MRFAKEHHTEIIILVVRVTDPLKDEVKKDFGDGKQDTDVYCCNCLIVVNSCHSLLEYTRAEIA